MLYLESSRSLKGSKEKKLFFLHRAQKKSLGKELFAECFFLALGKQVNLSTAFICNCFLQSIRHREYLLSSRKIALGKSFTTRNRWDFL